MSEPIRICVTGAAGQIGYSLLYMVASGGVFGKDQEIILHLLDITPAMRMLQGIAMELTDCALPLTRAQIIITDDLSVAFKDIDCAFLVGSVPRKPGVFDRKDFLTGNSKIFRAQGEALDKYAKKDVKVLVVGNPANTLAAVAAKYAPSIPKENFTALTRLDHNRCAGQIAERLKVHVEDVRNCIVWGNHSNTQFPDAMHASVKIDGKYVPVKEAVNDDHWLRNEFIETIRYRATAILDYRKNTSAMSAAKASCDHMRNWWFGTREGEWKSMAVYSDGSYGAPAGVIFSFPCSISKDRKWSIVQGLPLDDFSKEMLAATGKELVEERDDAFSYCQ